MSTDLCAQLAALPPVEVAGLVVDIAQPFRSLESLVLPLVDYADRGAKVRGQPVNLVVALVFAVALERHREALGLSRDQMFSVSYAFAGLCDAVLGVAGELTEQGCKV